MELAHVLREKRQEMNLTQQQLADKLHVTRQTLSRWENSLSYPNLDTLVELSDLLAVPLDTLLKGDNNAMVKKISSDVNDKRRYRRYLIIIGSIFTVILIWLCVLGYGRANQMEWIDRFNPFLETKYGYAVLPDKVEVKKERGIEQRGKTEKKVWLKVPQKVDAYVTDDAFSHGSWLKFSTGEYDLKHRWAYVMHKGSYVYAARLVKKSEIPLQMRETIPDDYTPFKESTGPEHASTALRVNKNFPWWPFN
ncbi:helix-turn-helix domain-containing protein [Lactobacillus sp. ESL0679]|uniref:helix-turn-helix domain-containing protein n=1 Tax=Lactobacillus sp. ESL0679 TaxID=2983209 RepID=UPI0023F997F0|nr:helix-turn-helix domain-containing protein [Lactobacillus sp. ESL0679]MDF7682834.1 helix-turn-helix domain-containing protein [Lactobacillus sp. ESL0679]